MKLSEAEKAILHTVTYSALFDWTLKLEELSRYLLCLRLDQKQIVEVYGSSPSLQGLIDSRDGYYFPRGREDLIEKRKGRETWSRAFLASNSWALKLVASVPYTRMVALSGSAAHLNMVSGADIDLFIITRGRRVWSVAVTTLVLTKLLGHRRIVCSNFILSDCQLKMERQELFDANQIVHLKPVIDDSCYRYLVDANPFVSRFYPNFEPVGSKLDFQPSRLVLALKAGLERVMNLGPAQAQEWLCRTSYSWYLRRKSRGWKTPQEVVLGKDFLKLHTGSHRSQVQERFQEALEKMLRP